MTSTRAHEEWSVVAPFPRPATLFDGHDRHHGSDRAVRDQLAALVEGMAWTTLPWVGLVEVLTALGRADVPLARLAEGHVDASRILDQAGVRAVPDALYGVWASRSQQTGVAAVRDGDSLVLDGVLRFASGTGVVDRALVPVWTDPDTHLLLDLDLHGLLGPGLTVETGHWRTAAMEVSRSHTLTATGLRVDVDAQVGDDCFYLTRPAFFPGGVGVAACWLGGAARIADLLLDRMTGPLPGALQRRIGVVRAALGAGNAVLQAAAVRLDDPQVLNHSGRELSTETRYVVAAAVHEVLEQAERIAGPAGLAYDEDLTRAVHDLRLYVLQENADGDATYLGGLDRRESS